MSDEEDEEDYRNRLGARFGPEEGNEEDYGNRLGARFGPEEGPEAEPEADSDPEPGAPTDDDDQGEDADDQPEADRDLGAQTPDFAADITNIRETFDGVTVYIPSDMHRKVDKEYQRLAYETEWEFQKNRHYQPLLLYYGLSVIESLEGDEVNEYLRRMDS